MKWSEQKDAYHDHFAIEAVRACSFLHCISVGESDSIEDNETSDDPRDNALMTESTEDIKADDENSDDQRARFSYRDCCAI